MRAVAVDGVAPTHDAIVDKRYAVVRPFLFLTREEPSGPARAFIDFVTRPRRASAMLGREGLIPVRP